jgi:hypothetical protein
VEKTLILVPAQWSAEVEAILAPAMRADPLATCRTLEALTDNGEAHLLEIRCDGELVGATVVRLETREQGDELVIVAAGGRLPGHSLLRSLLPYVERIYPSATWARIHTARRGMVRELLRQGYSSRELVMAKRLKEVA